MTDETIPAPDKGTADPGRISEYHAHVYYDPVTSRDRAAAIRDHIWANFPEVLLGRWHDQPVGPHTGAMYQVAFAPDLLSRILPWLMLNRRGLSVLLHPSTGDDYTDHTDHAAWLGEPLPLKLEVLRRSE
jgi:aromatic ring-cleaving dioxygenase